MHNFGLKTEVLDLKINNMSEYQIRKKHGGLDLEIAGILEATMLTWHFRSRVTINLNVAFLITFSEIF